MIITFNFKEQTYKANLQAPLDISIPLEAGEHSVNCFYAPLMEVSPVIAGDFIGSTQEGGLVNFMNVRLNPHGNGTHTECVGHIAKEKYSINKSLLNFHFLTKVVSIYPSQLVNGDRVILKSQMEEVIKENEVEAIVIRTLPNNEDKKTRHYSGNNPPYIDHEAIKYLVDCGINHFLIDLPSVDREEDDGKLLAHKAFWQYPDKVRENATITELIYVENKIKDGFYLLNLQIASFEIDVSPSKPVLYELNTKAK